MSTYIPDVFVFLQDCPRGLFGNNCLNSCSVHCQVQMECNKVTGHCFNGCQPGWGDHTCNTSTFLILLYLYLLNQLNDECVLLYIKKKTNILEIYHSYAAKLRTSMSTHNNQEYGKSIMTSHEINDRDKGAKLLIIYFICKINFVLVFKYFILLILRYTYTKNVNE